MRQQGEASCLRVALSTINGTRTATQVLIIPISWPRKTHRRCQDLWNFPGRGNGRWFILELLYCCTWRRVHLSLMTCEIFLWNENPQVQCLDWECSCGRFWSKMNTTLPALDPRIGYLLRTYLVQVSCIKDWETKTREWVTGLTAHSGRTMVKDFLLQLVFLFYTLWCNSWCLEAALFQADITVLAQSENQILVSCKSYHRGCQGSGEPLDIYGCFSIYNISNSQTFQMKSKAKEGMKVVRVVEADSHLPVVVSAMLESKGEQRLKTKALHKEHWTWSPNTWALVLALAHAVCSWDTLPHSDPLLVSSSIK